MKPRIGRRPQVVASLDRSSSVRGAKPGVASGSVGIVGAAAGAWGLTRAPGVADLVGCVGSVRSPAGQPSWVCSVRVFAADRRLWWSAMPGIGKTRLAAECAAEFEADGWLVVSASCLPLAEQLPLLPVVDGLRQLHLCRGGRPAGGLLAGLSPLRSGRHRQAGAGADVGVDGNGWPGSGRGSVCSPPCCSAGGRSTSGDRC